MTVDLRGRYEEVERAVCEQVPLELRHVPDDREQHYDAELTQTVAESARVVRSASADTAVEIKTCQPRKANGQNGQWVFHHYPHELLIRRGGRYLLAVLDGFDVEQWVLCGPRDLAAHLEWYDVSTEGYEQSASVNWMLVLGTRDETVRLPSGGSG